MQNENDDETNDEKVPVGKETEVEKEERVRLERQELLNRVLGGSIKTVKERVAFILNNSNPARNSDIELAWLYWRTFENESFNESYITKDQLKKLTGINSLTRSRAKIQNEYKLFQADSEVRKYRGILRENRKQEAIEQKPDLPFYEVFIDETGKNQDYLSVGSLWVVDTSSRTSSLMELDSWKKKNNVNFEFHFSNVNKNRVNLYKGFFLKFLSLNPSIGYKIIIVDNKGLKGSARAITDLTFHLINRGIAHENESGRASLPRFLQVRLDADEAGSDQLKLENLKERIVSQNINGLELDSFEALDSKGNPYIQAVDLFTSAVNRKLHYPGERGHKDELADYILDLLNFNINEVDRNNSEVDKSKVFNLSYRQS